MPSSAFIVCNLLKDGHSDCYEVISHCSFFFFNVVLICIFLIVENSERDGTTRPPDLPLEKPVCRLGSNS